MELNGITVPSKDWCHLDGLSKRFVTFTHTDVSFRRAQREATKLAIEVLRRMRSL